MCSHDSKDDATRQQTRLTPWMQIAETMGITGDSAQLPWFLALFDQTSAAARGAVEERVRQEPTPMLAGGR